MDVGRRRGANRTSVAAGSIWESRMIIDEVKGGIRVFNDLDKDQIQNPNQSPGPAGSQNGFRVFRKLKSGGASKRKTWQSDSLDGPSSPISISNSKKKLSSPSSSESESKPKTKKTDPSDLQAVKKSPIQSNKTAAARSESDDVSIDKKSTDKNKSPAPLRKVRSESADAKKNLMLQFSKAKSDGGDADDGDSGGPALEDEVGIKEKNASVDVMDSKSEEAYRELGACDEKAIEIGLPGGDGKCDDDDGEEEFVETEAETSQNHSVQIKGIDDAPEICGDEGEAGETKAVVVREQVKKANQNHGNGIPSMPISSNLSKHQAFIAPLASSTPSLSNLKKHAPTKPPITPNHISQSSFPTIPDLRKQSSFPTIPDSRKQSSFPTIPDLRKQSSFPTIPDLRKQSSPTIDIRKPNLRRTNSTPKEFQDIPGRNRKLQNLVDLVMWRDISKSALIFGIGTFIMLSSAYTKDFNLSLISIMSYLGLFNLAAIFLYKSIICGGAAYVHESSDDVVGEEEAIWLLKLLLPYVNEFLLKLRSLFSGDPATTMKLAVLLFLLARCGGSITIWKMVKLGFWGAFTVPKIYSLYSTQLLAYGAFWVRRFQDAWGTCSHKKAVGGAIFTVVWNLSSVVARVWAVFVLFVAVRYYQQTLVTDEWEEEEDADDGDAWQGQIGVEGREVAGPTLVEINKAKKGS